MATCVHIRGMIVLTLHKMQEEIPWIEVEVRLQVHGVIDLVGSSIGDIFLDLCNRGVIGITINCRLPIQNFLWSFRLWQIDSMRFGVQSKPEIRESGYWRSEEGRVKGGRRFVAEK